MTEIPYQVNKADMIKKTADLVNEKKIEVLATSDESDRKGMRVFICSNVTPFRTLCETCFTSIGVQSSFGVNNIALVNGRPNDELKELILHFVNHRHDVVTRRTQYLRKAEGVLYFEGLIIASDNIDEVIALIRASSNADEAREKLNKAELDLQAKAIVEMRPRQLTGLEQDKLRSEFDDLMKTIEDYKDILEQKNVMGIIKDELIEVRDKYRTSITD